jgi:hypothetical protein
LVLDNSEALLLGERLDASHDTSFILGLCAPGAVMFLGFRLSPGA